MRATTGAPPPSAPSRAPPPHHFVGQRGPFDVVGDVHGCADELGDLLGRLGYASGPRRHPAGRRLIFVGDLIDRGPDAPAVLERAMALQAAGAALCVLGNHEHRLRRHLRGRRVAPTHGLSATLAQLAARPADFAVQVQAYLAQLPAHMMLDDGRLVVAHAGLPLCLHGIDSGGSRAFAMYGPHSGALPEGHPQGGEGWARAYRGDAYVLHGHHPVRELGWRGRVLNLDTGCVFGGRLSALRYPEMELVSVPARRVWVPAERWNAHLEGGLAARPGPLEGAP